MLRLGLTVALLGACGSDADDLGIGAQCTGNDQCDADTMQTCLTFKGGYCGTMGCTVKADCPENSACVTHTDGVNYCFRTCLDKAECNANRDVENEANCSANITFSDTTTGLKACVPPSG